MSYIYQRGLFLGALLFSSALYGQFDAYEEGCGEVTLYDPFYTIDFEGRALFLKPSSSHLHYAAQAIPLPLPSPSWKIFDVKPDYHTGFDIGVKANCESISLGLNWLHYHSKDTSSKSVPSKEMIGPFFEIGPDALLYQKARGKAKFTWDAVNFNAGFLVNFNSCLQANFFGGVHFARLKQTLSSTFSNLDGNVSRDIHVPAYFAGVGPQLGMNLSWEILKGLRLCGESTASLLVGTMKNHTDFKSTTPALKKLGISSPNRQRIDVNHNHCQVVPAFEARLGLAYQLNFCKFIVSLEAGYEAHVYLNAIQTIDIGSEVVTPPVVPDTIGVYARTFQRQVSNFALSGPYVAVNVKF